MNLERDVAPTGFYDHLPKMKGTVRSRGRARKSLIGKLKPGLLKAVGYDVSASVTRRHKAVKAAVKKYGKSSTIKKLNAVAVYTRRTSPAKSKKFKADMKFAQKMRGGDDKSTMRDNLNDLMRDIEEAQGGQPEARPVGELVQHANAAGMDLPEDATLETLATAVKMKLSELAQENK